MGNRLCWSSNITFYIGKCQLYMLNKMVNLSAYTVLLNKLGIFNKWIFFNNLVIMFIYDHSI